MPKLTLQFEGRVLKEYVVGTSMTIGRLPDNTVVIDNPAVSGHHARVFREGNAVVLEDLRSTNGTYVNEQHVYRHTLRDGDVVLVGKHKLVFDPTASAEPSPPEAVMSGLGDTVYLDTQQHRTMLATLRHARAAADRTNGAEPKPTLVPAPASATGLLRVVDGRAEQTEYRLSAHTSLIGKSRSALVRLRGWFKPDIAVAIARNGEGYVATSLGGKPLINSQPLNGRHPLKDGDILCVSGLTLEFTFEGSISPPAVSAARESQANHFMSSGQRAATVRALT